MHDVVKETEWVYIDDPSDPHLSPDPIGPEDPNQPFVPFYECRIKTNISLLPNNFKILNIEQNSSDINVVNAQNSLPQDKNFYNAKKFTGDFNGDGKTDLLAIYQDNTYFNKYFIFSFYKNTNASSFEIIGQGTIDEFSGTKQILFGDYNGDGKTDIMLPDTQGGSGHTLWHIYYSNPKPNAGSFFEKESHNIVEYWPNSGGHFDTQTHYSDYYAMDINGDGKSDLVRIWKKHYKVQGITEWNNHDTNWIVTAFANNIGNSFVTGNKFTLAYTSATNHHSDSPDVVIPVVSSYKHNGIKQDLVIVHNHYNKIYYINFTKDVSEDTRLRKVISSGGSIVDEISYLTMEPETSMLNGLGGLNEFYSSNNSVSYPYIEIRKLPEYYLVSKLSNTAAGITKHQDFRYHGLIVNMNGLGMIGFNKTARSAWYVSDMSKRLWTVNENNFSLRGALKRSYTQLLANGSSFSFVYTGNPTGIVNSTVNNFGSYTSNESYYLVLQSQINKDFITGVSTETSYLYDNFSSYSTAYTYLLPTKVTTKTYLTSPSSPTGTKVTTTIFDNNPSGSGANYHIGRPLEISTVTTAYGSNSTTKELFTYSGNKLIRTDKRGNTTESKFLVEAFEYNSFGNVTKKTLSSTGYNSTQSFAPRVTEYTYDNSQRFVKTSTDIEGLVTTNVSFHPIYGIVTEVLNPFGLTSKVEVDHWGKVVKNTDYLGKHIFTTYERANNEYTTRVNGEDGSATFLTSDALGRPKTSGQKNIDGTWSSKTVEYDYLGRKFKESEPFTTGNSPMQWKITTFDDYGRQKTVQYPSGLTMTLTYDLLTVTGTDGVKTTTSTKDANGNVLIATDNGGTIRYQYYPDGNLKSSNYSGTIVSMEYDEWGRKTKLNDPSAGQYTYTYNAIGELLTETTPNGTTKNVYDNFGKIIETTIEGTNTDSKTTYTYDNSSKLVTNILFEDLNNAGVFDQFSYTYDTFKRPYVVTENKFGSFFERVTLFDDFGRPSSVNFNAIANGKQSAKWVKHTYKNGFNWQILDNDSSQIIWQTSTVNERGQLLTGLLGNGVSVSNTYDSFGFPTEIKHNSSVTGNIMTLNTAFDTQRGNLTSRYNSMFYWSESFQYDDLDRLTHYTNLQGLQQQQIYEIDGRIKENNLGKYNYGNSNKKYQNTTIDVSPESDSYYQNRLGIFNHDMESKRGWSIYEPLVFSFDENVSRLGKVSLKIDNTATSEKVIHADTWTRIDNNVPTEYTYSAWVKSDGTNPEAEIFLFMKTETETGYFSVVDSKISATSNDWVFVEKTFLVPANIKKLGIRLDNNGIGKLWFDDVNIRKTSDGDNGDRSLRISYNTWKSPHQIEESNIEKISFTYNYMNNRSVMFYGGLQADKYQRRFQKIYSADGTMEVKIDNVTNEVEFVTYIGGDAYSAPAILKSDGTTQNYLYLHRDYLGSIVAISNQSGNVLEKRLFDAWGEVLKIHDQNGISINEFKVFDRGYTGHEHLQKVALIHMNGRLYDAKLHRFLQPDNFIQDPYNTQNYNRYGYVLNNPLKYTDPSGEELISLTAIIVGAVIAATSYSIKAGYTYGFKASGWGFLKATFIGAVSGAATWGIGNYATTITSLSEKIVFQAFAHGFAQATFTGIQGGDPLVGFASGALSSAASSLWSGGGADQWQGFGGKFADSDIGMLAFGTVAGGAGASLTGGNFWEGAATGLVVSGLNHLAHSSGSTDDSEAVREKIASNAESKLNSPDYALDAEIDNFDSGSWKCNKFVYDVTTESGASPGTPNGMFNTSPPTAGQWADTGYEIKNWRVVSTPRRGDVVAYSNPSYTSATGHTGVMVSKTHSISAGAKLVQKNDFGSNQSRIKGGSPYVYRRFYAPIKYQIIIDPYWSRKNRAGAF